MEEADGDSDEDESDELMQAFLAGDVTLVILRIIIRKRLEVFPYLYDGR